MARQFRGLTRNAVGLIALLILVAAAGSGHAEKLAAATDKGSSAGQPKTAGAERPKAQDPTKTSQTETSRAKKLRTKSPSRGRPSFLESWNAFAIKHASLGELGYRLFPLALVAQGGRVFELFRAPDRAMLPEKLVVAQFSRQFVEQFFQRAIENDDLVDDLILGTKISGQSHLTGVIGIALAPSNKEIRFDLLFTGVARSRTEGVNTVVVLQNTAETQFQARKQFIWNSKGLTYLPAVAQAETRSTTHQIDTALPGALGRVARKIAEQKVAELRPQVDAIVSERAAEKIQQQFDARVDHSLAWAQYLSHRLPLANFIQRATRTRFSATRESVQFLVLRRDVRNPPSLTKVAHLPKNCDVSIRVHRGMLQEMIRDPLALLVGAAVFAQILGAEDQTNAETFTTPVMGSQLPDWRLALSPDGEWLVLEYYRPAAAGR